MEESHSTSLSVFSKTENVNLKFRFLFRWLQFPPLQNLHFIGKDYITTFWMDDIKACFYALFDLQDENLWSNSLFLQIQFQFYFTYRFQIKTSGWIQHCPCASAMYLSLCDTTIPSCPRPVHPQIWSSNPPDQILGAQRRNSWGSEEEDPLHLEMFPSCVWPQVIAVLLV